MGLLKIQHFWVATAAFLGSSSTLAQSREARPSAPETRATSASTTSSATPPNAAAVAEAQGRFRRALELHDEGNLDAARTELRRAYETAPNYKVLFNLAQIEFELLDYRAALATFERYLSEGGDRIPHERRAQVQTDIDKLRTRLGSIDIAVNVPGARITVDDVPVGTTPLALPVVVSAGRRRITASLPGYVTETKVVDVAGGDHVNASFELVETPRAIAAAGTATTATPPVVPDAPTKTSSPPVDEPAPHVQKNTRVTPWLGWLATAVLAGGAGVTGALALMRSNQLDSDRARFGVDPSHLERLENEATTFALASDICAGTAAFAGILSVYLTFSSNGERKAEQGRALRVAPSLGFVSVETTF
jgi:PEGA domain